MVKVSRDGSIDPLQNNNIKARFHRAGSVSLRDEGEERSSVMEGGRMWSMTS